MSDGVVQRLNVIGSRPCPIRSSALGTLEHDCHRKFFFRERLGIRPGTESPTLTEGSAYHECMQNLYLGVPPHALQGVLEQWMRKEREQVTSLAGPAGFLPGGKDVRKVLGDMELASYKGLAMAAFTWQRSNIPKLLDKRPVWIMPDGKPAVEVLLKVPYRAGTDIVVRADVITTDLDDKGRRRFWIEDHKTTSMDPMIRAQALSISAQAALYYHALTEWLKANEVEGYVAGICHNVIRKPTIKYCPGTKDKNGVSSYIERVAEWYEENGNTSIVRAETWAGRHFKERVGEVMSRLEDVVRDFAQPLTLDDHRLFPRAGDYACHKFNSPCAYLRLCTADPATWVQEIESNYVLGIRDEEELFEEAA